MKTFEQVRAEIEALPHREYLKLVDWLAERAADQWDNQIERDAESGHLDFLIEEAATEKREGRLRSV
jgi:hypothetical protein